MAKRASGLVSVLMEALTLGLVLSADSFSAAVAMGFRPHTRQQGIFYAASAGGVAALSIFAGVLVGAYVLRHFAAYDHWIAFLILLGVALHVAWEGIEGLRHPPGSRPSRPFHSFAKILLVSFATSLDALGVGLTLGMSGKPMLPFLLAIGLTGSAATVAGLLLARRLSKHFGPIMSLVGAVILALLSLQMLKI